MAGYRPIDRRAGCTGKASTAARFLLEHGSRKRTHVDVLTAARRARGTKEGPAFMHGGTKKVLEF